MSILLLRNKRRVVLNHRTGQFRLIGDNGRTQCFAEEVYLDSSRQHHVGTRSTPSGKDVIVGIVSIL